MCDHLNDKILANKGMGERVLYKEIIKMNVRAKEILKRKYVYQKIGKFYIIRYLFLYFP